MDKDTENLELILLDKCAIQSLNSENLGVVSKHNILVSDMTLIENLKRNETINKLSKLENTYSVEHWSRLAKEDLLGQKINFPQIDLKEIIDNPKELKKQIRLAKKVAKEHDDFPRKLLKGNIDLTFENNYNLVISRLREQSRFLRIPNNLKENTKAKIKKKKSLFSISPGDWEAVSQFFIDNLNNKPIRKENRHLKENERTYLRNKEWIDFTCFYFQTTEEEKSQIFCRWVREEKLKLEFFAPLAYNILLLDLTIALYIIKSKGHYKQEIMRDLGYLYYAHFSNVTFHTCDRQLKETIHKIPFLKHIREKMVWFYNDEEVRPGELNRSEWLKILKNIS